MHGFSVKANCRHRTQTTPGEPFPPHLGALGIQALLDSEPLLQAHAVVQHSLDQQGLREGGFRV